MAFDPTAEPCNLCGREPDECICGLAPDILEDPVEVLDSFESSFYVEDWIEE